MPLVDLDAAAERAPFLLHLKHLRDGVAPFDALLVGAHNSASVLLLHSVKLNKRVLAAALSRKVGDDVLTAPASPRSLALLRRSESATVRLFLFCSLLLFVSFLLSLVLCLFSLFLALCIFSLSSLLLAFCLFSLFLALCLFFRIEFEC